MHFASHSVIPPSVLPDISPARGEIGSFGFATFPVTLTIGEKTKAAGAISPLAGEMSDRTEGGVKERDIRRRKATP